MTVSNKKTKILFSVIISLLCIALALFFAQFVSADAAEANADKNGWVVDDGKGILYGELTDVDEYSSFTLDNGKCTINDSELDLTKEISIALRIKQTSNVSDAAYLQLAGADELNNWSGMTDTSAAVKLKLQTSVITPDKGFAAGANTWNITSGATQYITFYVGTGEEEDKSYVIVNGVKRESTAVRSAYNSAKAKLFLYAPNARAFEISSPFAPIITSASVNRVDLTDAAATDGITLEYINAANAEFTLKSPLYTGGEYTFDSSDYTVTPDASIDGKGTVSITRAALKKVNWAASDQYISLSNSKGAYKLNLSVKSGEAPRFTNQSETEFKLEYGKIAGDVSVSFDDYSNSEDIPVLSRGLAPRESASFSRGRETVNADPTKFEFSKTGNVRTLTLKKAYLDSCEQGTHWYEITTRYGALEFPVFIASGDTWATRAAKGTITPAEGSGSYLTMALNGWENGDISRGGRAFYTKAIDITKPIFIEYGKYNEGGWINFDFNSHPYGIEYCDEVDARSPSKIKVIDMVPNLSEQRRVAGSKGFYASGVIGIGSYLNKNNNDVMEIYVGENASQSYIKFNGHDITKSYVVSVKRSDFPNGVAYLSLLCATATTFEINKNINAPVVYYDDEEPEYELKTEKDITLTVKNASENDFSLKYKGKTLKAGVDYDFYQGELTVFGSYMKTIPYASMLTFEIESGGKSTEMHIPAHISNADSDVTIATNDSDIKYFKGEDLSYKFELGGDTVLSVIDTATESEVASSEYSAAGGTLTLKASVLSGKADGVHKFLLQTETSLVPFWAIKHSFENGYAASDSLDVTTADGAFTVSGGGSLVLEKLYDLTAGAQFELTMTEVLGYYMTGQATGNRNSYVEFRFYDIVSGSTAVFRVRPNAPDDVAALRTKMFCEISLIGADGTTATENGSMQISVFEKQTLKMNLSEGSLGFTVSDEPDIELNAGDKFGGKKLLLSVVTAEATADAKMAYVLGGDTGIGSNNPDDDKEPDNNKSKVKGCGCGGSLEVAGGAAIAVLCLLAAIVLVIKRRCGEKQSR